MKIWRVFAGFLLAANLCASASAQQTKAQMNIYNNAVIVPNGVGAITAANLHPLLQNMINSSCTIADPANCPLSAIGGSSPGSVIYGGSSSWSALGAGTTGQVLTSNGAAAPSWSTVSSGGVSAGTQGQIAAYAANGSTVIGVPLSCTPIETFGGAGDNATNNLTPFNNLVAAFGTHGGCIGFAPGIYQMAGGSIGNGALAITYPTTTPYIVSLKGAGQDLSILNWAVAPTGSGIHFATNKAAHAFHLSDLSFRVGVAATSSAAFSVTNSTALGVVLTSTINNVSFLGSDGGGATDYWAIGANIVTQSAVNFTDDNFWGPSGGATGVGISVSSASSPGYGVIYNVTGTNFFDLFEGFSYGSYIQGVAINDCNFTSGGSGIVSTSGATGTLAELSVVNSQFGETAGNGIFLQSPVLGVNISNNYFLTNNSLQGISGENWGGGTIIGNFFGVAGTVAGGQTAIFLENSATDTPTTIVGNTFLNNTTAVDILSTSHSVTVGLNTYIGNSNTVVNGGATACPASASGNCVGTATSGAGFVP